MDHQRSAVHGQWTILSNYPSEKTESPWLGVGCKKKNNEIAEKVFSYGASG
jgi:hypothetical protein